MRSIGCRLTATRRPRPAPAICTVPRSKGDLAMPTIVELMGEAATGRPERPARRRPPTRAPPDGSPGDRLGGARDRVHPPWTLTGRTDNEKDYETESCEQKAAQGRSQGAQGQARRKEGCDQRRSSGGRGSRSASPDRQESLTPPRPEGRQASPGRRPKGRGSPGCPQGGGARQGAPHRQESRRASPRAKDGGSRSRPPGREEETGRGRHGVERAHVPVELNLIAST